MRFHFPKKHFILPVTWLVIATCWLATAMGAVENNPVDDADPAAETRVYQVFGMDCPGCHGGLEKLVRKIPAVKDAKANYKEQQLVVTLVAGTVLNDEAVHDAIRRANFTVGERTK